jgi:hypothetical protein
MAVELSDIQPFEDKILEEAKPYMAKMPTKAFELRLLIAREYFNYGFEEKALFHYEEALKILVKEDKTEALVNTVVLSLSDKEKTLKNLNRLKNSSEGKKPELKAWIKSIETYAVEGSTLDKNARAPFATWNRDQKIEELIASKEFDRAFYYLGPIKDNFNINNRIRYDLVSSAASKKISPNLWCEKDLQKYPHSLTWSMRFCRFLKAKREGNKPTETLASIKKQLQSESPERLPWMNLVEEL